MRVQGTGALRSGEAWWVFALLAAALLALTLSAPAHAASAPPKELLAKAERRGTVDVIAELDTRFTPEGRLAGKGAIDRQRKTIAQLQRRVLRGLAGRHVTYVKRFRFIPAMAMEVDSSALKRLAKLPQTSGVGEDETMSPALSQSAPLVGADDLWAQGYSGQGQTIAILDTGIESAHPFLQGKVVSEACYSKDLCPSGPGAYPGAGEPCGLEKCEHGTYVAGIAAGRDPGGLLATGFSGVAKDADLVSIQIYSKFPDPKHPIKSYLSDQIRGLELVYALKSDYSIASVNLSMAGLTSSFTPCDDDSADLVAAKQAIDNLRSAAIAAVVPSGNGYSSSGTYYPACLTSAISVGASNKNDTAHPQSNSAYHLDLLAPGENIKSSWIGSSYMQASGTSAAAPHVAGAWAVLKSKYAAEGGLNPAVDNILDDLKATGNPVFNSHNGLVKPRLKLDASLAYDFSSVDLLRSPPLTRSIMGGAAGDYAGYSVASAGDVNADGREDAIVGARYAKPGGMLQAGSAWVVFGKSSTAPLDLGSLGSEGFRIDGAAGDYAGVSVAGAGDVNGDGRDDVIVGASGADPFGRTTAGAAYVVFGKFTTDAVDLAALGEEEGFGIDGAAAADNAGYSVASAGDVNRDGRQDVVVGAFGADTSGQNNAGAAYIVFGKKSTEVVDLASLGSQGFRIDGAAANDQTGYSVAGAGDANGDGVADVTVGAPYADPSGRADAGSAYVVFGKATTDTVDLAALGEQGFRVDGAAAGDYAGMSVAGAGDVNGDARKDLMVGAPYADPSGRTNAGAAYIVFGKSSTAGVDLGSLSDQGVSIYGANANDQAGWSVAGAGDANGDGRKDAIVGARYADPLGRADAGSAYLLYSRVAPSVSYEPSALPAVVGQKFTSAAPLVQRTGEASFGISPQLPQGLTIDSRSGVISGKPTQYELPDPYTVTMTDLWGSVTAEITISVTDKEPGPPWPMPPPVFSPPQLHPFP